MLFKWLRCTKHTPERKSSELKCNLVNFIARVVTLKHKMCHIKKQYFHLNAVLYIIILIDVKIENHQIWKPDCIVGTTETKIERKRKSEWDYEFEWTYGI